jgi:hypothetical protein
MTVRFLSYYVSIFITVPQLSTPTMPLCYDWHYDYRHNKTVLGFTNSSHYAYWVGCRMSSMMIVVLCFENPLLTL